MSDTEKLPPRSAMDALQWLYGEDFVKTHDERGDPLPQPQPLRKTLTVERVETNVKFVSAGGSKLGNAVYFQGVKRGHGYTAMTVARQYRVALGPDMNKWIGRKVILYAEKHDRSPTGWCIRVARCNEQTNERGAE